MGLPSFGVVVGGLSSRGVEVVQSTTFPAASMHGRAVAGALSSFGVVVGILTSRGVAGQGCPVASPHGRLMVVAVATASVVMSSARIAPREERICRSPG